MDFREKKDCIFIVADTNIREAVYGFLSREQVHTTIGCRPFTISRNDIIVATGLNDPGIYDRGGDLLTPFRDQYRHAVFIMDAEWEGAPPPEDILARLNAHLTQNGWAPPEGCAIVAVPEIDNWLWTTSPHTATALGWPDMPTLKEALRDQGFWLDNHPKPHRPKEAAEWATRKARKARSSALYAQVTSKVSARRCTDPAAQTLLRALANWFPA